MPLTAADFPAGTPLHQFFAWNARKRWPDRRYRRLCDRASLPTELGELLDDAVGNLDAAAHAAVFAALEEPTATTERAARRILVIRLSAFGDFVQALGPFAAIRRHHANDHVALLTTRPFAAFATELGHFDEVLVDERPGSLSLTRWLSLRRRLRRGRFDRVYDLQTSQRSGAYAWLLRPNLPEWSGIAWHCSHPHANLDRDRQHTLAKQAEQLLMAGIHPTPLPSLPALDRSLPEQVRGREFVLLVPGASPRHPAKRWVAEHFGTLAQVLSAGGYLPVVVGTVPEAPLAATIRDTCPVAVDLIGRTDLGLLAALAQRARLTIGNDSGVCHLAAAAGCPVIVLFSRETDPARHSPRGALVRILVEADLNNLAPETVIGETMAILQAGKIEPRDGPRSQRALIG